ncbi:hypothetical protein C8R43DRAFT_1126688 [Mycena crocata]|nr:hypothetical protein C8R43DRAFT_1126688 [Mycena crocata]
MPLLKMTPAEKRRARERENDTVAIVDGPQHTHYLSKTAAGQEPVMHLANNRTLVQKRVPKSSSGRRRDVMHSKWVAWDQQLIPRLIPQFVRLWHKTQGLRNADDLSLPSPRACHCSSIQCKITLVRFTTMQDLVLKVCDCNPAAQQLLSAGLFPCAPLRPTLAVDVRLLELAKKLFVRIAPNKTAWTSTLEDFLSSLGFTLPHEGSLRRLFASALEWYIHLRHMVEKHFDDKLEETRLTLLKESAEENGDTPSPAATPTPAGNDLREEQRGRRDGRPTGSRASSTFSNACVQGREERAREPTPEPAANPFSDPPPMNRPSEYLRKRCPLCFGGATPDPTVPLVRRYLRLRRRMLHSEANKAAPDPPKMHPGTHFVSEDLSAKMEAYVDGVRGGKPVGAKGRKRARVDVEEGDEDDEEDGYEHADLKLPKSVLDECEASFQAADEKREKASTQFYDDTRINGAPLPPRPRALVGEHAFRREKQFNVLLLAEMLFQHLPPKWGFLERYIDRLTFAVAVFHAFGHDWRCQLLNHPRKRPGFGFTNGEGCERFWHSVSHLIAHLRISSYHHRLYTLDTQVKHADEANLFKLAEWIRRRTLHSANKRVEAEAELTRCGHSQEFLREQWKHQVKVQTKPLAHALLSGVDEDIVDTRMAAQAARDAVDKLKKQLNRKEAALGSGALVKLKQARKMKYFELRMNLSAVYSRMVSRLRAGKFEREAVERPSRRQGASEFKLRTHTQSAAQKREPATAKLNAEYNRLCNLIATEIREKRAPPNAIAPKRIDPKNLFKLGVDDPIWQNAGLEHLEEGQKPPPWLSSETVRSGINAMLEVDRADEEDRILLKETRALRVWFSEDWRVVNRAMEESRSEPERYQFFLRRERLLLECRIQSVTADRGEDRYEARSESSEDEMEDFVTVDSEEGYGASSDSDISDFIE